MATEDLERLRERSGPTCPNCSWHGYTPVRGTERKRATITRRRQCPQCAKAFFTDERSRGCENCGELGFGPVFQTLRQVEKIIRVRRCSCGAEVRTDEVSR